MTPKPRPSATPRPAEQACFTIATLGCKVNQTESEAIAQALKEMGWRVCPDGQAADVCIVNTCTVTQKAAMQSRQVIRALRRSHPQAHLMVTGCHAQTAPREIAGITGVDTIVGHTDKHRIPALLERVPAGPGIDAPILYHDDIGRTRVFSHPPATASGNRTRPFLKVQDGCSAYCTYCIVPYARGPSRSMPVETVVKYAQALRRSGHQELVLTGIHLGLYGHDLRPPTSLLALLEQLEACSGMPRIRLSSIEPRELDDALLEFAAQSESICRHFHIPLQSGDNGILARMHRPYTREYFRERVLRILSLMPDAAIGVDTLVGFPGESDEAFAQTRDLIEELPVTYLHVFPFSARPQTPASRYPDQIPTSIIKARCRQLRALGTRKKMQFLRKFVGQTRRILVEEKRDRATGYLKGISSNYISVLVDGADACKNRLIPVDIVSLKGTQNVFGTLGR